MSKSENKILLKGTPIMIKIDDAWLPGVVKYLMHDNKSYMMQIYPGYPSALGGTWHVSQNVRWRQPEASVSEFINEFFKDFPSQGLI